MSQHRCHWFCDFKFLNSIVYKMFFFKLTFSLYRQSRTSVNILKWIQTVNLFITITQWFPTGCRGTLGCLKEVPPNFGFHYNLLGFLVESSIIYWLEWRQNFLAKKGAASKKKKGRKTLQHFGHICYLVCYLLCTDLNSWTSSWHNIYAIDSVTLNF